MKNRLISLLLMLLSLSIILTANASSFDDIMNLPDYEEAEQQQDYLEFDDFLADFQYYCKSWQASFNTNRKLSKTLDDGSILLQLDGVTFWLNVKDDRHEITQISVKLGDPQNAYKAEYSMLVKAYALIASLDYKRPSTSAERSSILSSVMDDFQQNVEPAVKIAQTVGSFPVMLNNSKYSYAVTFSESEGYDFLAVTTAKTEKTVNTETQSKKRNENADDSDRVPVEITALEAGKNATFTVKNNMDETLTELYFRVRYYDKEGNHILSDDTDVTPVNTNISMLTLPVEDGGLVKNQSIVVNATEILPFVIADKVDLAVSGYKKEDGKTFLSDESFLYWYSSDGGYPEKKSYGFANQDYFDEWFAEGKKISLGIWVDYVYPEHMDYYGVDQCGYLITKVREGSILDKNGIKVGDVLYSSNGQTWYNNHTILDRAKWELTEGKDVTFELLRGGEKITVTITPSEISDSE